MLRKYFYIYRAIFLHNPFFEEMPFISLENQPFDKNSELPPILWPTLFILYLLKMSNLVSDCYFIKFGSFLKNFLKNICSSCYCIDKVMRVKKYKAGSDFQGKKNVVNRMQEMPNRLLLLDTFPFGKLIR